MSELIQIKTDIENDLLKKGYSTEQAKSVVDNIVLITGYFKGKPSRVLLKDNTELYL